MSLAVNTPTRVDRPAYERDGYLAPVAALSANEAQALRQRFEDLQAAEGGQISASTRKKPHLLLPWLADLVRDPRIVGPVQDLLGPDVLCWSSIFFAKQPDARSFVAWHQDATYWGLSSADVVTAWVAFTPSTPENGCLRVVPGTHKIEHLPHRDRDDAANLLSRGQEIAVDVDEAAAVDLVLSPGEMSLHHVRLVHGSEPNRSAGPRIGYAIRYIAGHVRQLTPLRDSATLVAGRDLGHFDLEPAPASAFHPDAVAFHRQMLAAQAEIQAKLG